MVNAARARFSMAACDVRSRIRYASCGREQRGARHTGGGSLCEAHEPTSVRVAGGHPRANCDTPRTSPGGPRNHRPNSAAAGHYGEGTGKSAIVVEIVAAVTRADLSVVSADPWGLQSRNVRSACSKTPRWRSVRRQRARSPRGRTGRVYRRSYPRRAQACCQTLLGLIGSSGRHRERK